MGCQYRIQHAGVENPEPHWPSVQRDYLRWCWLYVHRVHADDAYAISVVAPASGWVCHIRNLAHRTAVFSSSDGLRDKMVRAQVFGSESLPAVHAILFG